MPFRVARNAFQKSVRNICVDSVPETSLTDRALSFQNSFTSVILLCTIFNSIFLVGVVVPLASKGALAAEVVHAGGTESIPASPGVPSGLQMSKRTQTEERLRQRHTVALVLENRFGKFATGGWLPR